MKVAVVMTSPNFQSSFPSWKLVTMRLQEDLSTATSIVPYVKAFYRKKLMRMMEGKL